MQKEQTANWVKGLRLFSVVTSSLMGPPVLLAMLGNAYYGPTGMIVLGSLGLVGGIISLLMVFFRLNKKGEN
jgi:hypothetical protein